WKRLARDHLRNSFQLHLFREIPGRQQDDACITRAMCARRLANRTMTGIVWRRARLVTADLPTKCPDSLPPKGVCGDEVLACVNVVSLFAVCGEHRAGARRVSQSAAAAASYGACRLLSPGACARGERRLWADGVGGRVYDGGRTGGASCGIRSRSALDR